MFPRGFHGTVRPTWKKYFGMSGVLAFGIYQISQYEEEWLRKDLSRRLKVKSEAHTTYVPLVERQGHSHAARKHGYWTTLSLRHLHEFKSTLQRVGYNLPLVLGATAFRLHTVRRDEFIKSVSEIVQKRTGIPSEEISSFQNFKNSLNSLPETVEDELEFIREGDVLKIIFKGEQIGYIPSKLIIEAVQELNYI